MFIKETYTSQSRSGPPESRCAAVPGCDGAGRALAQPRRFRNCGPILLYSPRRDHGNTSHGPSLDKWTPSSLGATFKLSPIRVAGAA